MVRDSDAEHRRLSEMSGVQRALKYYRVLYVDDTAMFQQELSRRVVTVLNSLM